MERRGGPLTRFGRGVRARPTRPIVGQLPRTIFYEPGVKETDWSATDVGPYPSTRAEIVAAAAALGVPTSLAELPDGLDH